MKRESLTEQGRLPNGLPTNAASPAKQQRPCLPRCETARFDAIRASDKANAAAEKAARLLAVSREHLVVLLGPFGDKSADSDREKLSEFTVRAPLARRVEERHVVNAARMTAGSPLFTLADTRKMRVSAEIHERDWEALKLPPGEDLQSASGTQGRGLPRQRSATWEAGFPDTHSVPLVADIDNGQAASSRHVCVGGSSAQRWQQGSSFLPAHHAARRQAFVFHS